MTRRVSFAWVVLAVAAAGCDGGGDDPQALPACVTKYPRGTMPTVASNDQIVQAINECRGDSGQCLAQLACRGTPADRVCDAKLLITAGAAVCAAEANGLARGIMATPRTGLVYDFVFRRITWSVSNTMYDGDRGTRPDAGGALRGGQSMAVDAITAKVLNSFEWSAEM
jgi:hypothetical protein